MGKVLEGRNVRFPRPGLRDPAPRKKKADPAVKLEMLRRQIEEGAPRAYSHARRALSFSANVRTAA
eukprot:12429696-Alexandrium_andersonii.AAC.1